jgi:hypothetical protein
MNRPPAKTQRGEKENKSRRPKNMHEPGKQALAQRRGNAELDWREK